MLCFGVALQCRLPREEAGFFFGSMSALALEGREGIAGCAADMSVSSRVLVISPFWEVSNKEDLPSPLPEGERLCEVFNNDDLSSALPDGESTGGVDIVSLG